MCPVIQLNHCHHTEPREITENKVNVFASDAIEGRLPTTPARIANGPDNVCEPDLGENLIIGRHRLLKNSEKRTLGWSEQSRNRLVFTRDTLRCLLPTKQPNQRRGSHKKHKKNSSDNQWYVHDVRSRLFGSNSVKPLRFRRINRRKQIDQAAAADVG